MVYAGRVSSLILLLEAVHPVATDCHSWLVRVLEIGSQNMGRHSCCLALGNNCNGRPDSRRRLIHQQSWLAA